MIPEASHNIRVDVIIPVHTPNRQIDRAVRSVELAGLNTGAGGNCRITLICHNTDIAPIRQKVEQASQADVRYIQHSDSERGPAGPFNRGIAESDAPWFMIMGSDDTLEPGALSKWLGEAERTHADVLIAPEAHFQGSAIHTPVVRPFRRTKLDPIRDRLTYRTAPLGLIKRALVDRLSLRFPAGLTNGSDQLVSAKLWFSGLSIIYGRGLPRYIVHADAKERVTLALKDLDEDLLFATELVKDPWFQGLPEQSKHAIVTKLIRVHLFSYVGLRAAAGAWNQRQAEKGAAILRELLSAAPKALGPLSIADRRVVDALEKATAESSASMAQLCSARRTFQHPRTWVPRDPRYVLHREAPIRFMSASFLVQA